MNQGHVDNLPELGHHCLSLKLNEGGGNKIVFKKKIAVFFTTEGFHTGMVQVMNALQACFFSSAR